MIYQKDIIDEKYPHFSQQKVCSFAAPRFTEHGSKITAAEKEIKPPSLAAMGQIPVLKKLTDKDHKNPDRSNMV